MEIGPDGSLCHITNSVKDSLNNIKIVKVSEEEMLKTNGPPYKLIFIGEEKDCESVSEKSDEELFEIDNLDIQISSENFEVEKNFKTDKDVINKPQNKNPSNRHFRQNQTKYMKKKNYHNYNSSGRRNFKSSSNVTKSYKRPMASTSADIEPWLNPHQILSPMEEYQFRVYPPQYGNVMEPCLNTTVNSTMDKPCGLLGDSPYSFPPHNFQANNQNMFGVKQSYWNNEYSNNYSRTNVQQITASDVPGFKNHYHRNKYWKHKGSQKSWKQNQKGRRNRSFDYRTQ